jgi:pyrroloquinoline quinone (PQQ) biosynthesis protein C
LSTDLATSSDYTPAISKLVSGIHRKAALDNEFYRAWMTAALPYLQVRAFAREYRARTQFTSVMVALSVLHTEDLAARIECVKNLYSEYGGGDPRKVHLILLDRFLEDLVSRVPVSISDIHAEAAAPTTRQFSEGQRALFTNPDQRVVQGALLGQEHLAYSMLTRLYEGVRNYKPLWPTEDEFHEACEYFYVHIGEAEKDHKREAVISAAQVCRNDDDFAVVRDGFHAFLDLTAKYWQGVHRAMSEARPS